MSSVQSIPLRRLFDDVQKEGFSLGAPLTDANEIAKELSFCMGSRQWRGAEAVPALV